MLHEGHSVSSNHTRRAFLPLNLPKELFRALCQGYLRHQPTELNLHRNSPVCKKQSFRPDKTKSVDFKHSFPVVGATDWRGRCNALRQHQPSAHGTLRNYISRLPSESTDTDEYVNFPLVRSCGR